MLLRSTSPKFKHGGANSRIDDSSLYELFDFTIANYSLLLCMDSELSVQLCLDLLLRAENISKHGEQ